jgi:hypothetical protein
MSETVHDQIDAQFDRQEALAQLETAQAEAMRGAVNRTEKRKENPNFHAKISELDLDSEAQDWVETDLGAWLSAMHLVANRKESYRDVAALEDANRAEREIYRGTMGRALRQHPDIVAQALALDWSPQGGIEGVEGVPHHSTADQEAIWDAAAASTARKTMGVMAEYLSSLTDATTESIQRREGEREASRASRIAEVFR